MNFYQTIKKKHVDNFQTETGHVSQSDFRFILNSLGDIHDDSIIEDVFAEFDLDCNGMIDYREFSALVKTYLTDEDLESQSAPVISTDAVV
jgi:hypothetical protein